MLDSLQAGGAPQALLAAETLDRVTVAVPGSLAPFPDTAATRAHLIVAFTEAGLAPADAVVRAAEQMGVDSTARETRRAEGEAAAGAPRSRAFLARAWADAADDADALPQPAEDRFATLFTDAYTASGDERVARTLAFKRLLGEIGEGKGRDWVGEEGDGESGDESAEELEGGISDDRLAGLTQSLADVFGAGGGTEAGGFKFLDVMHKLARRSKDVSRFLRQLDEWVQNGGSPAKNEPSNPNAPSAPRSIDTRPVPKPEEPAPEPTQDPPSGQHQAPLRPTGIADLARQEVERERQRRKDERAARRNAGKSDQPPTLLQQQVVEVFREHFRSSGQSKVSLDIHDVSDNEPQSSVIKEFVHAEASGDLLKPGTEVAELRLGEISSSAADEVFRKSNKAVDIRGKRHVLPSDRMRHALNTHGVGNEKDPKQEGITAEDIARFTEFVDGAERVKSVRVRGNNSTTIAFEKRENGTYVVVELLRKDDTLEFFNMWKVKAH